MSVEHVLPASLHDGLIAGVLKPDSIVVKMKTGGRGARSFSDYELVTYSGKFLSLDATEEELEEVRAFLRHIEVDVFPFWILEPFVFAHDEVCCGPLADGSQTSFIFPFRNYTALYSVMEDSVYTEAYTLHTLSNLLANDNDANAVLSIGSIVNEGGSTVVTRKLGLGVTGRTCFKIVQAASAYNGLSLPAVAVDSSQLYFFRVSIRGSGTFIVRVIENDGGATTTDTAAPVTGSEAGWVDVTVPVTTTGTTSSVEIQVLRVGATAGTWFAGAIGAQPGDFVYWFPPSSCPGVFEMDSAPSENDRMTCGAKGKILRRVAFDQAKLTWHLYTVGHAYPQGFVATEVMEF